MLAKSEPSADFSLEQVNTSFVECSYPNAGSADRMEKYTLKYRKREIEGNSESPTRSKKREYFELFEALFGGPWSQNGFQNTVNSKFDR
jgi:hypothetical protein